MKSKVILLTVFLATLVCGCAGTVSKPGTEVSKDEEVVEYTKEYVSSDGFTSNYGHICDVRHFNYNGHSYIQFEIAAYDGANGGIVHDPDCRCGKGVGK